MYCTWRNCELQLLFKGRGVLLYRERRGGLRFVNMAAGAALWSAQLAALDSASQLCSVGMCFYTGSEGVPVIPGARSGGVMQGARVCFFTGSGGVPFIQRSMVCFFAEGGGMFLYSGAVSEVWGRASKTQKRCASPPHKKVGVTWSPKHNPSILLPRRAGEDRGLQHFLDFGRQELVYVAWQRARRLQYCCNALRLAVPRRHDDAEIVRHTLVD